MDKIMKIEDMSKELKSKLKSKMKGKEGIVGVCETTDFFVYINQSITEEDKKTIRKETKCKKMKFYSIS